jgi:hypothetical protein
MKPDMVRYWVLEVLCCGKSEVLLLLEVNAGGSGRQILVVIGSFVARNRAQATDREVHLVNAD